MIKSAVTAQNIACRVASVASNLLSISSEVTITGLWGCCWILLILTRARSAGAAKSLFLVERRVNLSLACPRDRRRVFLRAAARPTYYRRESRQPPQLGLDRRGFMESSPEFKGRHGSRDGRQRGVARLCPAIILPSEMPCTDLASP